MTSLRAHLLNQALKLSVKKRLHNAQITPQEIARSRKRINRLGLAAAKRKTGDVSFTTETLNDVGVCWCEPKTPSPAPRPVLLHYHGGAYLVGSSSAYRGMGANLALAANARVALIDYALAPESPFPAAPNDALTAYKRLLELGHRPEDIAISGDSAGGNLALVTLQNIVSSGLPQVAAAVLLSPWSDLTASGASITQNAQAEAMLPSTRLQEAARLYAGSTPLDDRRVSPLFGDFHGLPPLLIHVGAREILRDDARRVHERTQCAGVASELKEWPGMPHVFQAFADIIPEGEQAINEIAGWLGSHWG